MRRQGDLMPRGSYYFSVALRDTSTMIQRASADSDVAWTLDSVHVRLHLNGQRAG